MIFNIKQKAILIVLLLWLGASTSKYYNISPSFAVGNALLPTAILTLLFFYIMKKIIDRNEIEKYDTLKIFLLTISVFFIVTVDTGSIKASVVNFILSLVFSIPYSIYIINYIKKTKKGQG